MSLLTHRQTVLFAKDFEFGLALLFNTFDANIDESRCCCEFG
jgi:hypothetical protein